MSISVCNKCGDRVDDIDVGFSPAIQRMKCECGGLYCILEDLVTLRETQDNKANHKAKEAAQVKLKAICKAIVNCLYPNIPDEPNGAETAVRGLMWGWNKRDTELYITPEAIQHELMCAIASHKIQ
jgi:hypothetical protein